MRAIAVLGLLALQTALPVVAISGLQCDNCTQGYYDESDYFGTNSILALAGPPPPPPNRRPPPPPPAPLPGAQPADDTLWSKSEAKGCTLSSAMQASDADAGLLFVPVQDSAKSPYDSPQDLMRWFWSPFPQEKVAESFRDLYSTWGIGWALRELGINEYTTVYEGGKNELAVIDHQSYHPKAPEVDKQFYSVDNDWYRATGASYSFTVNPEQGIIIGLNRESPKWAAKDRKPPVPDKQLPQLNQFSDVAWIAWKALQRSGTSVKNLKYFVSTGINNVDTQRIVKRALEAKHWELSEYPGHTFEGTWPETKAILGSPNVQGFGYFLIQHKAELGNMFVEKIQVFKAETKRGLPCILVHVSQPVGKKRVRRLRAIL